MEDFFDINFFQGLVSNIIVATLFSVIVFILLKPRIDISPYIAKRYDAETKKHYYKFKFINKSYFGAFDVNLSLSILEDEAPPETIGNQHTGQINYYLEPSREFWDSIPRYKRMTKNTRYTPHCITFRELENDIEELLSTEGINIKLSITLKHGFSGLSKTYEKEYRYKDCVKESEFKFGNNLNCVKMA